jgi:fibro-slime domain-containing protein
MKRYMVLHYGQRRWALIWTAVLTVLLLSGCGSSEGDTNSDSDITSGTDTSTCIVLAFRCELGMLQQCDGTRWVNSQNCALTGTTCMEVNGVSGCVADSVSDSDSTIDTAIVADSATTEDSATVADTASIIDTASVVDTETTADTATIADTESVTDTAIDTNTVTDTDLPGKCGNSTIEDGEGCDDGNTVPFDGCSVACTTEPNCSSGACVSECGDGLVLGEECDDGNLINGDGCSNVCKVETGFTCEQRPCRTGSSCPETVAIDVIYRDFAATRDVDEDFGTPPCTTLTLGLVGNELNSQGKPVSAGPNAGCIQNLDTWYTREPAKTAQMILYADGAGGYVNRFGDSGEPWMGYAPDPGSQTGESLAPDYWQGEGGELYVDCAEYGCVVCPWDTTGTSPACEPPAYEYDGTPLFFPLDDLLETSACTMENSLTDITHEDACAKIPAQYGMYGWPWEARYNDAAHTHNFYFTSELGFWFIYDPETPATLTFAGDDDAWVFVNGQLAVDLGGVHIPETGSVRIDENNAFGMVPGQVYRINLFHAERKVEASSFKLHISGFSQPNLFPSNCNPGN